MRKCKGLTGMLVGHKFVVTSAYESGEPGVLETPDLLECVRDHDLAMCRLIKEILKVKIWRPRCVCVRCGEVVDISVATGEKSKP